jgi:hypothetical protein
MPGGFYADQRDRHSAPKECVRAMHGHFRTMWYSFSMTSTKADYIPQSIVPIDGETRAILDYAESVEARLKFRKARQEIDGGKGIEPTADYFTELNRRISERARNTAPNDEA